MKAPAESNASAKTVRHLKQLCNHPGKLSGNGRYLADDSGKFERLAEICDEIASRQQRALVFTQFRGTIEERIDAMIDEKRQLAAELLEGGAERMLTEMTDEELIRFVSLDVARASL